MKNVASPTNISTVLALIEEARNAELCRDLAGISKLLETVWPDFDQAPDYSAYPASVSAELLRLSGFYLSYHGRTRGKPDYQLRGKDIVSESIRLFESINLSDKAAEAKIFLALCYWHAGEFLECESILDEAQQTFAGNTLHPVYLQICVNQLMTMFGLERYEAAKTMVNDLLSSMELCNDRRLKAMFHNQAGIIHQRCNDVDGAEFHLTEAIRHSEHVKNFRFLAINLNNLAFLYKDTGRVIDAHRVIDKALAIFKDLEDVGEIPNVLDTKALIFIEQNNFNEALVTINTAIDLLRVGEDTAWLCEALMTKTRCLLKLGRTVDAFTCYGELHNIASRQIGESATSKYAKALAAEVFGQPSITAPAETSEIIHESEIYAVALPPDMKVVGQSYDSASECFAFFCTSGALAPFGVDLDSFIAVKPTLSKTVGGLYIYSIENKYAVGRLQLCEDLQLYSYDPLDGSFPVLDDDVGVVGLVSGYCPCETVENSSELRFIPFHI